jgi:cyclopropane fatty-acyl-phospholipid synthase-like methyltransferase
MAEPEYEPPIPDEVWHSAMRWNVPLSEAHASMLLDAFELERAERVLDLGCGWGELLLRAVQRSPTLTGRGVDSDTTALARGTALAAQRGLDDRVELVDFAAESWTEPADRVINVGAKHIWDDTAAALAALAQLVSPGGRLLYGDGYLEPDPSEFTAQLFDEMLPLNELLAAARSAGWRVLHLSFSDQLEWDEFESTYRAGTERWLLDNPDADDASRIRAWLDRRMFEYLDGYRGELGFCWLVLAHDRAKATS